MCRPEHLERRRTAIREGVVDAERRPLERERAAELVVARAPVCESVAPVDVKCSTRAGRLQTSP